MHGCQLMNLTAQLLVCLFVKAAILNINGNDARNDLNKADLVADKIAWHARLYANDSDEALRVAEEDDGQCHQAVKFDRIGPRLSDKIGVALSVVDQQWPPFIRHPAAITFSEMESEMHPTQRARSVGGP